MAARVGYQAFCPTGAALNAIGERWALLIVRDLMLGPRRYTDLLTGLGGIGTDILAARLRSLQTNGVLRQVGEGRNQSYELTEAGHALRPVLIELARWGANRLRLPTDPSQIPPRVLLTALLIGPTELPRQANGHYEIRVGGEALAVEVVAGEVRAAPGSHVSTTIRLTLSGLRGLIVGVPAARMEETGDAAIYGERRNARVLLDALSAASLLDELRPQLTGELPAASRQ